MKIARNECCGEEEANMRGNKSGIKASPRNLQAL